MSTLCLFVLLGGGAYAAMKVPDNSIGMSQLQDGAVTGVKVAAKTLTGANIGSSCTHLPGAEVTIDAPGDGTVVVSAIVRLNTRHSATTDDIVEVFVGTSPTDCPIGTPSLAAAYEMPAQLPTVFYPS